MDEYQRRFIDLSLRCKALQFGSFVLKSGRVSPYFFNSGRFRDGNALRTLGWCYAEAFAGIKEPIDSLYGPAYKGIPIAALLASRLASTGINLLYAYSRKEVKEYGEGGQLVGAISGNVLIADDVITAGTAAHESMRLIRKAGAEPVAVLVALDRREKGIRDAADLPRCQGMAVYSIMSIDDLIKYLAAVDHPSLVDVTGYRNRYGVE